MLFFFEANSFEPRCDEGQGNMKLFKSGEYIEQTNPTPGSPYRPEILTAADGATDLGGMFGLLPPGSQVPYHFHQHRESIIIVLRGEATQVIDGKEVAIEAGDVLYLPAGEKHMTINRSSQEFRYLPRREAHDDQPVQPGVSLSEVFTCPTER